MLWAAPCTDLVPVNVLSQFGEHIHHRLPMFHDFAGTNLKVVANVVLRRFGVALNHVAAALF